MRSKELHAVVQCSSEVGSRMVHKAKWTLDRCFWGRGGGRGGEGLEGEGMSGSVKKTSLFVLNQSPSSPPSPLPPKKKEKKEEIYQTKCGVCSEQ